MQGAHGSLPELLKALSNERRFQIVEWLLDPTTHFAKQVDGDLIEDGVCLGAIVRKIGASQPTVTGYMQTLVEAGLVSSKKIKNWVFFKPRRDVMLSLTAELAFRLDGGRRNSKDRGTANSAPGGERDRRTRHRDAAVPI